MSFKEKFKSIIGIDEEEYEYEEDDDFGDIIEPPIMNATSQKQQLRTVENRNSASGSNVSRDPRDRDKGRVQVVNTNMSNMSKEAFMSKVIIREPKEYSDAQNIADCLKEDLPVFINLQRLDKNQGKRVIDFLSGTIYAIDGEIKRVGGNLFLCTPKNVSTDGSITEDYKNIEVSE